MQTRHYPEMFHDFKLPLPYWVVDPPRQIIWSFVFDRAMETFWTGHGLNAINFIPGANKPIPGLGLITYISGHPHDWVLEIFAEAGIFGVGAVILVALAHVLVPLRRYLATPDPALLTASSVAVGFWVSGLFNYSFWSVWWLTVYAMTLAFCLAGTRSGET